MKKLLLVIVISTFSFSGFYNDSTATHKAAYTENTRLCKIFTKKVKKYKSNIRDDALEKASLASYERRTVR